MRFFGALTFGLVVFLALPACQESMVVHSPHTITILPRTPQGDCDMYPILDSLRRGTQEIGVFVMLLCHISADVRVGMRFDFAVWSRRGP